jgi:hypothetical protein
MSDKLKDFYQASKREGELFGISGLDDPNQMRRVFTAMTPELRRRALDNLDSHLGGTFERTDTRRVAKLGQLRADLRKRHSDLLKFGR